MEFCDHLQLAQDRAHKPSHFQCGGALCLNAAMSTEQTHQRLGVAEGVIRELQD